MAMDEKAMAAVSTAATSTIAKLGNTSETTKQTEEKSNHGEEKHQQGPLDQAGRFQQFKERGWFDDLDESITKPDFRFNVGGVDCVPSGEITAISGKAGAGKSTALAILIGVLIGQTEFAGIRCMKPCQRVLWIDTEKGKYSCKQKMSVFRQVANIDSSMKMVEAGVFFATMRQETTEDRLFFIEELSKEQQYDVVVIDGIFDLTTDPDFGYIPVTELMRRLADRGITIFAMLHTNKGDENMRYALGSELQRLCTTRFNIEFDLGSGLHTLKHEKSNDTAIAPEVSFVFDESGNVVPSIFDRQKKNNNGLEELLIKIFEGRSQMRSTDIKAKIMELTNVKERTADKRMAEAKECGFIELASDGKEYVLSVPF